MTDRFAHHIQLDRIHDGQRLELVADDSERGAIARRLGIPGIERLEAHVTLSRTGETVRASGRINASLTQSCAVTNEPVAAHVDEPFETIFMPAPEAAKADDEVELGEADCDIVFYDGAVVDVGTAVADTLALSLDPYPRSAGADAALKHAGVLTEGEASPFAVLAKLKKSDET